MENPQPLFNALMNLCSTVLLLLGYLAIKKGEIEKHKKYMISALATSALFLASYLWYHYKVGHNIYVGEAGPLKTAYLIFLASHVILAIVILPFIFATFFYGFRGQLKSHKKVAKITFPVWLYVSVTGVLLYLVVYHVMPQNFELKPPGWAQDDKQKEVAPQ